MKCNSWVGKFSSSEVGSFTHCFASHGVHVGLSELTKLNKKLKGAEPNSDSPNRPSQRFHVPIDVPHFPYQHCQRLAYQRPILPMYCTRSVIASCNLNLLSNETVNSHVRLYAWFDSKLLALSAHKPITLPRKKCDIVKRLGQFMASNLSNGEIWW